MTINLVIDRIMKDTFWPCVTASSSYFVYSTTKHCFLAWPLCGHIWCFWCINTTFPLVGIRLSMEKPSTYSSTTNFFLLTPFFPKKFTNVFLTQKPRQQISNLDPIFVFMQQSQKYKTKINLQNQLLTSNFQSLTSRKPKSKSQNLFSNKNTPTKKKTNLHLFVNCTPNTSNKKT